VHHVDEFTTPALIECQLRSILDPNRVLVVSRTWQRRLHDEYGVAAEVVSNGVDVGRFRDCPPPEVVAALRARAGATDRPLLLTVGGIEPRKGTDHLFRALALLRRRWDPPPVLAIVGGHSFQDHTPYRERVIAAMPGLDLAFERDVVPVGTVPDPELPAWYHAADALVFPSVTEGFGLAVIEAMAAGLPVVLTDLPVFAEYLHFGRDALAVPPGDEAALAAAIETAVRDDVVRGGLIEHGRDVATRFSWDETARQHEAIYRSLTPTPGTITGSGRPGRAGS
jgi:glycosyltransferase involved in cell wall biosynthesis